MDFSLLSTKLRIPLSTQRLVQRPSLIDGLEREVAHYKLILIAAPAGYGKTTLLGQWAHASHLPVVWLSLSKDDNDPERFLRYLLTGWEQAQPDIAESPVGLLLGGMSPDIDAVLPAFINVADCMSEHVVFILDDYHLIDDPAIHQALTFLFDHLPPTIHFMLSTRGEPALPLARYRARQELFEIQTEDLRFQHQETSAFLNDLMHLELDDAEVASLQTQMEGWITGLQLAALTLRRRGSPDELVISGQHRFIADYLNEDVLVHLSDARQRFLLQTSILDRLSGSLCDAVTGNEDGQEILETLERENLFLVPLDDDRQWYRYHGLFAEFLRTKLERRFPADIARLHRRAACWYLTQNQPEQAFEHIVPGNAPDLAIRMFERYMNVKLNSGEVAVVGRWLNTLPAEWYATQPLLILSRGAFLAITGDFEGCLRCINESEQALIRLETEEAVWQLAIVAAIRCFIACMQNDLAQAERYANHALRDLREESRAFRANIYHALGDIYRRNAHWNEAQACYLKVPEIIDAPGFQTQAIIQSAHVFGALADLELRQGRLRKAADYWRKALASIQDRESWGRVELPVTGWVYIRMGEIFYEWNMLADARDHLSRGLRRAELGGDARTLIAGYLLAARLNLTDGDIDQAAGKLDQARSLVEDASSPEWVSRFERIQLECWLFQDRLRAAVNWADEMLEANTLQNGPESEAAHLAISRVLLVMGDMQSVEHALTRLGTLLETSQAEGRTGITIETLALQSLACWRGGDRTNAVVCLERTLRLAEPEGYQRLFTDLGLPMARVLQEAHSRDVMPDYIETLLTTFNGDLSIPNSPESALPEPLTDREQEILGLIAAGLTNPEIADELIISPQTVKKHAGNIYGKLGVHSRTEAAARARELDLLG